MQAVANGEIIKFKILKLSTDTLFSPFTAEKHKMYVYADRKHNINDKQRRWNCAFA